MSRFTLTNAAEQVTFDYIPREHFIDFHKRRERWSVLVCHRRMGKTVACVNELVLRALYTKKKNARYSYIAPTFTQAKDIAWSYLKDSVKTFATQIRESELRVVLPNGAWITLYGSDNQDRLRGIYHDGVILDEYGDCRPSLWGEIILPALLDRDGWAVFIGTPKGKNHFYKTYQRSRVSDDWYSYIMPASQSGVLSETQLDAVRAESTPEEYAQEMECSFTAAVRGTYYADLIEQLEQRDQISANDDLYEPTQSVNVAADIGFSDSTAFWFWQHRADGIAIIDHYENQGKRLEHYFEVLKAKKYEYEAIFLPHDAKAKTLQTGRSTVEQFLDQGFPCQVVPRLAIQHGIDAARYILPKCWFNSNTTSNGVESLRAYRRKWDEVNQCFADKPLHDWASDSADAFRYLSLVCREKLPHKDERPLAKVIPLKKPEFTLDQLFKERDHANTKRKFEKMRI